MPTGIHDANGTDIKTIFVDNTNERRANIFAAFEECMPKLRTVLQDASFTVWVDGSFVTRKDLPNDIDLVVFLSPSDYQDFMEQHFLFATNSPKYLHIHFCEDTPQQRAYWTSFFSTIIKKQRRVNNLAPSASFKTTTEQKKGFIRLITQVNQICDEK